jgi:hypothetical protein
MRTKRACQHAREARNAGNNEDGSRVVHRWTRFSSSEATVYSHGMNNLQQWRRVHDIHTSISNGENRTKRLPQRHRHGADV